MEYEDNDSRHVSLELRTSCAACPFFLEHRPLFQILRNADTGERRLDLALFRRRFACSLPVSRCRSVFNTCAEPGLMNTVSVEGVSCRAIPSWMAQ